MLQLFQNDFLRMVSRKSYLGTFATIPFIVYLMANQSLKGNELLPITHQTTFNTFALYTPMHKIFSIFLFSIVVIFVVTTIAGEYETGEIRMVLIRGYHSWQILMIKYLNILISIALFLIGYVAISYLIGALLFPRESMISTFLSAYPISSTTIFEMTIQYYVMVFLILAVFAGLICLICLITQSVITSTALSMVMILVSLGFYLVTKVVMPYVQIGFTVDEVNLFSLLLMQLKGLYQMIGGNVQLLKMGGVILSSYAVIFLGLSFGISYKRDQLI